jgi:hypothetical protein
VAPKTTYSAEEVANMDAFTLTSTFMRVTKRDTLACGHCGKVKCADGTKKKKETAIVVNWVHGIRKFCSKKGIYPGMPLPKTCDTMQARNELMNPVNNPHYQKIRAQKRKGSLTSDVLNELVAVRSMQLASIRVNARPYRHLVKK